MSKPIRSDRFDAAVAEAPPLAEAPAVSRKRVAVEAALGGDEIIQLSIRPSPWFVAIVSMKWIVSIAILLVASAIAARGGWGRGGLIGVQILVVVLIVRLGIATLQWASRTYVLTNRRVMRFKGLINVHVVDCPLARIAQIDQHTEWYHRPLRIGSIRMAPASDRGRPVTWEHVANPDELHDTLVKAIRRSQSGD